MMGEIIRQISGFYDGLMASLSGGSFAMTSSVVVTFLFALAAIFGMGKAWFDWIKGADRSQSVPALALDFAQHGGRYFLIWLFVGITPLMFQTISGATVGALKGLNAQVAAPAAGLMDQAESAIKMVWSAQMAVQQGFVRESPMLLAGYQSGSAMYDDAQAVQDEMAKSKVAALQAVAASKTEAQKLLKSASAADQKRGAALLASTKVQEAQIKTALTAAEVEQARSLQVAKDHDDNTEFQITRGLTAVATVGVSEVIFLVQRVIVGVMGFVAVAIPLVLALMMAWKLLQSCISLFSHLAIYAAVVSLAAAFSAAVGPLMVATFATQEWRRFGQNFVSFWVQALAGSLVLAMAIKLVAAGIGTLCGMCATAGFAVYSKVTSTTSLVEAIIAGTTAGLAFMGAAFAMDGFSGFVQKSPQAGIGPTSGGFHP